MAYFEDLSLYPENWEGRRLTPLNVGWLSCDHPFPVEAPEEEIIERVWQYCQWPVAISRGWHDCELCEKAGVESQEQIRVTYGGLTRRLGGAEIWVVGRGRKIYCAPDLIFHYITQHRYRPPDEFVKSLRAGPSPPSLEYFRRIRKGGY